MTNIEEITGYFQSFDEKEIFYRKWVPKENPKKIVFVGIHGGAVNSKNMKHPGEHFSKKGYPFYAQDRRGHGNCDKKEVGYVKDYNFYIKDNISFVDFIRKEEKPDKIVLIGHSNGGGIAIATALYDKKIVDTLVLSAPTLRLFGNNFVMLIKAILAGIVGTLIPKLNIPHGIKPEELCWDQEVIKERYADPLYWPKVASARWAREIFRFARYSRKNFSKLDIPALFLIAGDDKIVDSKATLKFFSKIKDKPGMKLNYYEGYLHEIFNEEHEKRNKIFKDIEEYLKI